jgi:hypothetical protein
MIICILSSAGIIGGLLLSIRYAEIGEYDKAIETIKLIESDQWKSQALQEISRVRTRNKL